MRPVEKEFAGMLSSRWWILLVRGLVAIVLGVIALLRPDISLAVLVAFFAAYALVDGVFAIWFAISGRKVHDHWWLMLIEGLIGVAVGIVTVVMPGITAIALVFYIAIWAVVTGILEIVDGIRLRKEIEGEWMLILGGLASVLLGVLLVMRPDAGALALIWMLGIYAIVFGVAFILLAFKVRRIGKEIENA